MEKREIKYLINYKREIDEILSRYDLSTAEGRYDCTEEIKSILLIDEDCANRNNCTATFKQMLRLIDKRAKDLKSYTLFEFIGYIMSILDMLGLYWR